MDYDCILELVYNWNNFFEKKKNSCAKRFFKAAIASFISAFKAAWNIKGKLNEHYSLSSISKVNDTHMEELDSVQKFTEIQGWLLLTFFHLFTQSTKFF